MGGEEFHPPPSSSLHILESLFRGVMVCVCGLIVIFY